MINKIDRVQTSTFLYKFSLFGFLLVACSVVAFLIKISVFTNSSNKGYLAFIIQNLALSLILFAVSRYMKKDDTQFAVLFDTANGWLKLFCLSAFAIFVIAIYEILKNLLA